MDERTREVLPLVAWLGSLVVAIVLFTAMGGGQLAAPPVTDPGAWGDWLGDRDGVVATMAILRLLVLAMAWYLVGVTTIGAVARVARWARLVRVADGEHEGAARCAQSAYISGKFIISVIMVLAGEAEGPRRRRPVPQLLEALEGPGRGRDEERVRGV